MSCRRCDELDLAAFAAEPAAAEWEAFRAHYPGCADCSRSVADWTRLRVTLRELEPSEARHPNAEEMLAYAERPGALTGVRRSSLEAHLQGCKPCRSEFAVLRNFDFGALGSEAAVQEVRARVGPTLVERLVEFLESLAAPLRRPAFAMALLGLLALPIGVAIWRSLPGAGPESLPPIAREEVAPPAPTIPAPEAPTPHERVAETPPRIPSPEVPAPAPAPIAPQIARGDDAPPASEAAPVIEPQQDLISELLQPSQLASLLPESPPTYQPQLALAGGSLASVRTSSVVRGVGGELPAVRALGPDHVGATQTARPVLYWHLSSESRVPVRLTLIEEDGIEPLLELHLEAPVAAGIHQLDLGTHDVRLDPGRNYQWFISLVPDVDAADTEQLSQAVLRYTPASSTLMARLEEGRAARRPQLLAGAGYWLDAFHELSEIAAAAPAVARPAEHRAALLRQVGLADVAEQIGR